MFRGFNASACDPLQRFRHGQKPLLQHAIKLHLKHGKSLWSLSDVTVLQLLIREIVFRRQRKPRLVNRMDPSRSALLRNLQLKASLPFRTDSKAIFQDPIPIDLEMRLQFWTHKLCPIGISIGLATVGKTRKEAVLGIRLWGSNLGQIAD